jgi:CHAT domain-containing protein/tetratricopeptide (TPR) repeat protein
LDIYRAQNKLSIGHAVALNNLATLRRETGSPAEAESLLREAVEIREKIAPSDLGTAVCISNLASVYDSLGDSDQAIRYHRRALEIRKKQNAPLSEVAASFVNLGGTLARQGDEVSLKEAVILLNQAVQRLTTDRSLAYPDLAIALGNRSHAYLEIGLLDKAIEDSRQAVELTRDASGSGSFEIAAAENNLASLLLRTNQLKEAIELREKVLALINRSSDQRMKRMESGVLQSLAKMYLEQGMLTRASTTAKRATTLELEILRSFLAYASEEQRYHAKPLSDLYAIPGSQGDSTEMARLVLNTKGVVLDSALAQRAMVSRLNSGEQKSKWSQLQQGRAKLREILAQAPSSESAFKLRSALESAERKFYKELRGGAEAFQFSDDLPSQISALLGDEEWVVEFTRYPLHVESKGWEGGYGAVVLRHGHPPEWIQCSPAEGLDSEILSLTSNLKKMSAGDEVNEQQIRSNLSSIRDRLILPIEQKLGPLPARIWISGDGYIHLVPFSILPTVEGGHLIEKTRLCWIHSARVLLNKLQPIASVSDKKLAILADPDHLLISKEATPIPLASGYVQRSIARDASKIQLDPLPSTAEEAGILSKLATNARWQVATGLRAEATEGFLRSLNQPTILHFACHGVFMTRSDIAAVRSDESEIENPNSDPFSTKFRDPMVRSWLALAGSQRTLDAWASGKQAPFDNDGILMAAEVAELDLQNTQLATLSACRTAIGEIADGEGVVGLRRGFAQAGVHHLLTTLWPVDDAATREWMAEFYKQIFAEVLVSEAVWKTQNLLFNKWQKEKGWLWAVYAACPFILISHGR